MSKIDLDANPQSYYFEQYTDEINIFAYRIGHLQSKIRKLKLMRMEVCQHIFELSQIAGENSKRVKCGHEISEDTHLKIINS